MSTKQKVVRANSTSATTVTAQPSKYVAVRSFLPLSSLDPNAPYLQHIIEKYAKLCTKVHKSEKDQKNIKGA